jgi:hypothetical protein
VKRTRVIPAIAGAAMAALLLAGCGRSGPATQPSPSSPGGSTAASLSSVPSGAATQPAPEGSDTNTVAAVQKDLAGLDTAASQADTDLAAGDAASSQNDQP